MSKTIFLAVAAILLAACSSVRFPDPEEPAFIEPLQTELAQAEAASTSTEEPSTSTPLPPTLTPSPTPIPHDRYTGVVMGGDFDVRRPERNRFGVRSDVFLIYVFDFWPTFPERNQVSLISLPRDLWLEVPCSPLDPVLESHDRVNAAWAYGQFDCARDTVEAKFNLEVNAPMLFTDFDGFMWVVERLGAVRVVPTETYTDFCGNYHGTDGDSGREVTWYEGQEYSMGPNEALCYVRGRDHPTGDLDRNRRGLEMIEALGEQYVDFLFDSFDPDNIISELFAFMIDGQQYISVSLDLRDLVTFAPLIPEAERAPRRFIRMGLDETDFWRTPIYGASVLIPTVDLAEWLDCMIELGPIQMEEGHLVCTEMFGLEEGD